MVYYYTLLKGKHIIGPVEKMTEMLSCGVEQGGKSAMAYPEIGSTIGNYRLLRSLGEGGAALVYLGEHIYLQNSAAIKILHGYNAHSLEALQIFLQEARIIARLNHPHIVRLLDFGVEQDLKLPYLVMEYAVHGALSAHYPRGTQLSLPQTILYTQQVASALQYAHDQKFVHCDVKPDNMLMDANDTLLLSDFGIATVMRNSISMHSQEVAGTFSYMAPEQFLGKPTPASDQYALGVVVYEWLCGQVPFQGTLFNLAHQHLYVTPAPLHQFRPELSVQVEQVVLQALAKEPEQRFETIQAFAEAFSAAGQEDFPLLIAPFVLSNPFSQENAEIEPGEVTHPDYRTISPAPMSNGIEQTGTLPTLSAPPEAYREEELPPLVSRSVDRQALPAHVDDRPGGENQEVVWDLPPIVIFASEQRDVLQDLDESESDTLADAIIETGQDEPSLSLPPLTRSISGLRNLNDDIPKTEVEKYQDDQSEPALSLPLISRSISGLLRTQEQAKHDDLDDEAADSTLLERQSDPSATIPDGLTLADNTEIATLSSQSARPSQPQHESLEDGGTTYIAPRRKQQNIQVEPNQDHKGVPTQIRVFLSYSHSDSEYRRRLQKYLAALERLYPMVSWYDGEIQPGAEFDKVIKENLEQAHLILLLVSQDFIASKYCHEIELKTAMERHEKGEAIVIPIILYECLWEDYHTPFGKLQALPDGGKPIRSMKDRNAAFTNVSKGIERAIRSILSKYSMYS